MLLRDEDSPFEEVAKAAHLGINGIINADIGDKQQIHKLEELFRRYRPVKDKLRFHRLIPNPTDRLQLIFTHPNTMAIVTGSLLELSIQGVSFKPSDPSITSDLQRD